MKEGSSARHSHSASARGYWCILPTLTTLLSRRASPQESRLLSSVERDQGVPQYSNASAGRSVVNHKPDTVVLLPWETLLQRSLPGPAGLVFLQSSPAFAPEYGGLQSTPHLPCFHFISIGILWPLQEVGRWLSSSSLPLPATALLLCLHLEFPSEIQPSTGSSVTTSSQFAWKVPPSREPFQSRTNWDCQSP